MATIGIHLLEYMVIAGASLIAVDLAYRAWNDKRIGQICLAGAVLVAGFFALITLFAPSVSSQFIP